MGSLAVFTETPPSWDPRIPIVVPLYPRDCPQTLFSHSFSLSFSVAQLLNLQITAFQSVNASTRKALPTVRLASTLSV